MTGFKRAAAVVSSLIDCLGWRSDDLRPQVRGLRVGRVLTMKEHGEKGGARQKMERKEVGGR